MFLADKMTQILIVAQGPSDQWIAGRVLAESGVLKDRNKYRVTHCSTVTHIHTILEQSFDIVFFCGEFENDLINSCAFVGIPTIVISNTPFGCGRNRFVKEIPLADFDGELLKSLVEDVTAIVEA